MLIERMRRTIEGRINEGDWGIRKTNLRFVDIL
jgi:hypothetical protein